MSRFKTGDNVEIRATATSDTAVNGKVMQIVAHTNNIPIYMVQLDEGGGIMLRIPEINMTLKRQKNERISWADLKHIWNPTGERNVNPIK